MPFDEEFVTYVWFDALVNYFSVPNSHVDQSIWPADIHVIGKDILNFHAVYWPIILKVLNAPLPKTLLVHGWWLDGNSDKISKSYGNVVDPIQIINEYGVDAFRYHSIRELAIGPDGNWADDVFRFRYNAELVNDFGNLINRVLTMLNKYRFGVVPSISNVSVVAFTADTVVRETGILLKENNLQGALVSIWKLVDRANVYIERTQPFQLAKDPVYSDRLDEILYNLVEVCRLLAVLVWPFIPGTAEKIYNQLNLKESPSDWKYAEWGTIKSGHRIGTPAILFPRK